MNNRTYLNTGRDPRTLPDYVALRDEMMKLSHPARPDVDWHHAQALCLRLFEHNGVELQTAAWFTLVCIHTGGLAGMNEGLALVCALASHQWSVMWPANIPARMEALSGLFLRLQKVFRTLKLDSDSDLPVLYQTEKYLSGLENTLARYELKQESRMSALQQQVRLAVSRLENASGAGDGPSQVVIPLPTTVDSQPECPAQMVYVIPPAPVVNRSKEMPMGLKWRFFAGGFCSALLAGGLMVWGWQFFRAPSPVVQQLQASLTQLPGALSSQQLSALRHDVPANTLLAQTRRQLQWLGALPPDWSQQYSRMLISQVQTLLPGNPDVTQINTDWQQQMQSQMLPPEALNGWHEGMMKLMVLTERLNALDEKHGRYMTVSELKTAVFAITRSFNQATPVEEELRLARVQSTDSPARRQQLQQVELHLRAQAYTLAQEKARHAETK